MDTGREWYRSGRSRQQIEQRALAYPPPRLPSGRGLVGERARVDTGRLQRKRCSATRVIGIKGSRRSTGELRKALVETAGAWFGGQHRGEAQDCDATVSPQRYAAGQGWGCRVRRHVPVMPLNHSHVGHIRARKASSACSAMPASPGDGMHNRSVFSDASRRSSAVQWTGTARAREACVCEPPPLLRERHTFSLHGGGGAVSNARTLPRASWRGAGRLQHGVAR